MHMYTICCLYVNRKLIANENKRRERSKFQIFSSDSTLLCASSSHGTIHVFSVEDPKKNKQSSLLSSTPFLGAGKSLVSTPCGGHLDT